MNQKIKKALEILSNLIEKPINIFMAFISLTALITSTATYLYLSLYAKKCQEFYKIPAKYFGQINLVNLVSDLLPIITLLVVIIILTLISIKTEKKTDSKNGIIFYLVNIILGTFTIFIIYQTLLNITLEFIFREYFIEFISMYVTILPFIYFLFAFISGCVFIFSSFFTERFPKLVLVQAILILIMVVLIIFSAYYSLPIEPQDKRQYEVTFINDEEKNSIGENRVILSEVGDNFLTVSYALDSESDKVIFYTQSYKLIPMEGLELRMNLFNQEIKIDSDSESIVLID